MRYFIAVWILDNSVNLVETDTMPIVENHSPDTEHDFRILAEVSGEFQEAITIHDTLSYDGEKLIGLDFIAQIKEG